jgi:replicative DNA helicase
MPNAATQSPQDSFSGPRASQLAPHSLDAEAAVLSALMLDPENALDEVRASVAPRDFYSDANRLVFESVLELDTETRGIDEVTISTRLRDRGQLDRIGGVAYLAQLIHSMPAVLHVQEHARIVRTKAQLRRMIAVCRTLVAEAQTNVGDITEFLQSCEQRVFDAAESAAVTELAETLETLIPSVIEDMNERRQTAGGTPPGIDTGFVGLTGKLNGYVRTKLYIVAGRPGMGKSAFLSNTGRAVAGNGDAFVCVSAEMTKGEQVLRLLAAECDISIAKLMAGDVTSNEWVRIVNAADVLRKLPIALGYCPGASVQQIRSAVRRKMRELRRKHGSDLKLGLIGVDYIQILRGAHNSGREQEVSEISRGLLHMAGEFDAPVMALSQLNREVEKRPNKRPQLSDLRDSGAIEQDAYAVLFLYRDEYYNEQSEEKGVVEVNVAKHRNGPTGVVKLSFEGESTRFDNLQFASATDRATAAAAEDIWSGTEEQGQAWQNQY